MSDSQRRVSFRNMIYIADGPSDVPAFSVVKHNGGSTLAVYPPNDDRAIAQVDRLLKDDRVDIYAEANYTEGSMADQWIKLRIRECADRMIQQERNNSVVVNNGPAHLI